MRDNEVRTNTYHRGREALRDIEADTEKGLTYLKWMAICEALDEARKEAKEEVGLADSNLPTHRLGGGYNKAFGAILKREKLNSDIINSTTRSHAFSVIEHRVGIEAYRKDLAKKDPARYASLNHPSSIWRAFSTTPEYRAAHPKPTKPQSPWGNRTTPTQPLTEEDLRARSGIKPTPQHIEKAAAKQAAEAEAEAAKLDKTEAELDDLRQRVRVAELAVSSRDSEIEELKAARPAVPEPATLAQALEHAVKALTHADALANKLTSWPEKTSQRTRTKHANAVREMLRRLRGIRDVVEIDNAPPPPTEEKAPKKKKGKAPKVLTNIGGLDVVMDDD
jgi:hypothetical protein